MNDRPITSIADDRKAIPAQGGHGQPDDEEGRQRRRPLAGGRPQNRGVALLGIALARTPPHGVSPARAMLDDVFSGTLRS